MNKYRQKLTELNNTSNNRRRKSPTEPILLLIAQVTTDTNGWMKWLVAIAGIGAAVGISLLVALAIRGL